MSQGVVVVPSRPSWFIILYLLHFTGIIGGTASCQRYNVTSLLLLLLFTYFAFNPTTVVYKLEATAHHMRMGHHFPDGYSLPRVTLRGTKSSVRSKFWVCFCFPVTLCWDPHVPLFFTGTELPYILYKVILIKIWRVSISEEKYRKNASEFGSAGELLPAPLLFLAQPYVIVQLSAHVSFFSVPGAPPHKLTLITCSSIEWSLHRKRSCNSTMG